MKHLNEGHILAARDGEALPPHARQHLEACTTCRVAVEEARARSEIVARTLTALDGPIEATAAKAGVRARLGSARRPRRSWGGGHLGRAAALLLLTAGAAAALPWSPVRTLWRPSDPEPRTDASVSVEASVEAAAPASRSAETGIAVPVSDGYVQVVVRGADPGTVLEVTWSDQDAARLAAPAGSRFTYAAGRVEVDAARGRLGVQLPRAAGHVSLEVDGRLYLSGSPAAPEVLGPAVERSEDGIRFSVETP